MNIKYEKARARLQAKMVRANIRSSGASLELVRYFPALRFRGAVVAGYWPLPGEMDVLPLLSTLHEVGANLALPCTPRKGKPLIFREWQPGDALRSGSFGTKEPKSESQGIRPDIILLPLLAFTSSGERLGYGGGFYDRTLAGLRETGDIFACGVAFSGQEAASLPSGEYDMKLDGVLTENGFKEF